MTSRLDELELELSALADLAPTSISEEQTFGRITQRRRRRQTTRIAFGAVCMLGVVSGLVAINRTHRDSTASGAPGPTTPLRGAEFVAATEPPMVTLAAPGWTVDYFADAPWGQTSIVVVDAARGFAGGSFVVENVGEAPVPTTVPTGSESNLADEGIDGQITNRTDDSYRSVTWHVGNVQLQASARNLSLADTLAITRSVAVAADGSLFIGEVPAGLVSLPPPETGNLFRRVEYRWASDDGARSMQFNLYPGGDLGTRIAPTGSNVQLIAIGGHDAFLSEDGMRVDWLDGFWVWEATGEGYADLDSFLADAALLEVTDRATWEAELAGHTVLPTERPQQVATMLADVPLPPGFDISALASADRALDDDQLVAEVTSAVWCEWVSRWDAALTAGDDAAAHTAAAAIASSTGWQALLAIDSKGGWSSAVWEYSARVTNGDRSVVADSKGGLGCSSG